MPRTVGGLKGSPSYSVVKCPSLATFVSIGMAETFSKPGSPRLFDGSLMSCNRGESEKRALEQVRQRLCGDADGRKKIDDLDRMFGFSAEETDRFSELLFSVEPNKEPSAFPDFISSKGFIEHFRVTASLGRKKRSEYLKREATFNKRVWALTEGLGRRVMAPVALPQAETVAHFQPMAEYRDLESSFRSSWCKHMDSRSKYLERNEAALQAFLVEMPQPGLEMFENIKVDNLNGRKFGDLYRPEHLTNYRLSRDKNLLKWIFENADGLDYVLYLGADGIVEVINVSMIPTMIELLRWDYCIAGALTVEVCSIAVF